MTHEKRKSQVHVCIQCMGGIEAVSGTDYTVMFWFGAL